ncbi:2-C-methyl-D-erythritol 4-phosphate cytidylyltransferase [Pasteurella testudinis DSM 23072]|uniref:2-C-methyl-D-erythritol 4-phosphate cytidylyltransferase n=1 Tax=Pasteurella testudinis DSM 23072 TaxID=1122938 RepID=A0A1W1UG56_9PAST|nr:2-C-methyl-D-erythritol 4-phosphate cytidylyltransferase [Pasteurella testudinis]SMB79764.1 2-C-methyl-D-erythritol 4-phosphate cytidylyltransferase [Pasteurella testudinis DSM 23072]SUB50673.1 2-C-methyl-D-erythritol 4-phosphate cytidylyltransferase [Pasteurella testudinis]
MQRKIIAIVPAAGSGSRMLQDKPKQYLLLNGKTILQHTLDVLLSYPLIEKVILVVAQDDPYIARLALQNRANIELVTGGETRADSVFAGLRHAADDSWVLVHDAARPCLTHQDLDKLLQVEDQHGAILAYPVTDTIKRADSGQQIQTTEDRSQLWHALTPQFFPTVVLREAYAAAFANHLILTDEASAMELAGYRPHLVHGRSDNLKVTRPEDLALAEFYLQRRTHK